MCLCNTRYDQIFLQLLICLPAVHYKNRVWKKKNTYKCCLQVKVPSKFHICMNFWDNPTLLLRLTLTYLLLHYCPLWLEWWIWFSITKVDELGFGLKVCVGLMKSLCTMKLSCSWLLWFPCSRSLKLISVQWYVAKSGTINSVDIWFLVLHFVWDLPMTPWLLSPPRRHRGHLL